MPKTSPNPHVLRRFMIRFGLGLIALWLLICAIVGLWLPGKLKHTAEDWGVAHGYPVEIEAISINPFRWTVVVKNARLTDSHAGVLFAAKSLSVEAKPSSLLSGELHVGSIALTQPTLGLSRKAGGEWNWASFISAVKGPATNEPAKPNSKPPKLLIDHIELTQGHIVVADGNERGPEWLLDPVNLSLDDLSTMPVEGGYHLTAALDDGARLDWHGSLALMPFASDGDIHLTGLTLTHVWPFLADKVHLATPKGDLEVSAHYRVSTDGKFTLAVTPFSATYRHLQVKGPDEASKFELPELKLTGGDFDLNKHRLDIAAIELLDGHISAVKRDDGKIDWLDAIPAAPEKGAPEHPAPALTETAWHIALNKIALKNWKLAYHDNSVERAADYSITVPEVAFGVKPDGSNFQLADLQARIADLIIKDGGHGEPIKLESLALAPSTIALADHKVQLGKITLNGLGVGVSREANGKIDLVSLFKAKKPKDEPPSAWKVEPSDVVLERGQLSWRDQTLATPVAVVVNGLHVAATSHEGKRLDVALSGQVEGNGKIAANLKLTPENGAAQGSLALDDIPLQLFAPYTLSGTSLHLASGTASTKLQYTFGNKAPWQIGGSFNLARLAILEPGLQDPLVGWNSLDGDGLLVQGGNSVSVSLDRLRVDTPRLRVKLDSQRKLNLTALFTPTGKPKNPAPNSATATQKAPPKAASALPLVTVRAVVVKSAEVDFADQSLNPGFATRMHDVSGTLQGISTDPARHTTVTLDGLVDSFGSVKIRGTLEPITPTDDSILVLGFQNIPVNSLDPYSANFAGWHIEDGRLNVDLRYALKNKQLDGQNRVVIQSLKLGKEVDDPSVKRLPLNLAIALLEDSDGRIDLNLPVSGRLDDPQFSYGKLIGQAIETVVEKVVSAPFRALASMFGSEGFDTVTCAAGLSDISAPEREKLEKLSNMLAKRPRLTLRLGGNYDPAVDGHALARSRIDTEVLTAAGLKPEVGMPVPRPDFDDPVSRSAIRNAYAAHIGRIALANKLLATKDDSARYSDMRTEMIATEEKAINDAALQQLASLRAEKAKAVLLGRDATLANRIVIEQPQSLKATAEGVALTVKLETR